MKTKSQLLLACSVLLVTGTKSHAEVTFTKITNSPVVLDTAGNSLGATWVDLDGDGHLDLFVSNSDGANLLYRNDGYGGFTKITTGSVVNPGAGSYSASWADYDNDGRIDLFIGRRPGPGLLFRQQPDGSFVQSNLGFSAAFGAAWADYDSDGWLDLLVAYDGLQLFWHNDQQGNLLGVAGPDVSGDAIAWADYDNDGDLDVFIAEGAFTGGGSSRLYRNDGRGIFTPVSAGQLISRSAFATAVAWGDYDNDGFPDLFLPRGDSAGPVPSFLFHNNGDGTFTQVEQSPFTTDKGFGLSCSWADYDNDGWLDLFVSENNGTVNRLYHNNGNGTFTRVMSGPIASDIGNCAGSSWGDYDRDGFLDLFVSSSGNNYLYHNNGNSNAWLTIKCVGTRSNRSAIGAKVRVKATIGGTTFWQLREITTGDGWAGKPLEAHFGLGNATNVQTLRIEWPSGTVQEIQNVTARQILTITEPAQWIPGKSNSIPQFTLHGGRNMQWSIEASSNLVNWSSLGTILITNLNGKVTVTDTNAAATSRRFYRAALR